MCIPRHYSLASLIKKILYSLMYRIPPPSLYMISLLKKPGQLFSATCILRIGAVEHISPPSIFPENEQLASDTISSSGSIPLTKQKLVFDRMYAGFSLCDLSSH